MIGVKSMLTMISLVINSCYVLGQDTPNVNEYVMDYLSASNETKDLHFQQLSQGSEYAFYYPGIKGHQFWKDMTYHNGELKYDGVYYTNVFLNYDVYNDLLMYAMSYNGLTKNVILDNIRVEEFRIDGTTFVNIKQATGALAPAIYRIPFDGNRMKLYAKLGKRIVPNNRQQELQRHKFVMETTYILVLDEIAHPVNNKRDLQAAFVSYPEVQEVLKKYKFKFKNEQQLQTDLLTFLNESQNYLR